MEMKALINNGKLAERIIDCISDGYDDEENREEAEEQLCNELSNIGKDNILKIAIMQLCERIEELLKE